MTLDEIIIKHGPFKKSIGFWCPPGWINLLDEMLIELNKTPQWSPDCILQCKEKFGSLRVYFEPTKHPSFNFQMVNNIVDHAEERSSVTCQDCGNSGVLKIIDGLYKTCCDQHTNR